MGKFYSTEGKGQEEVDEIVRRMREEGAGDDEIWDVLDPSPKKKLGKGVVSTPRRGKPKPRITPKMPKKTQTAHQRLEERRRAARKVTGRQDNDLNLDITDVGYDYNYAPMGTVLGERAEKPHHKFYSEQAKYASEDPKRLAEIARVRDMSLSEWRKAKAKAGVKD